MGVDEITKWQAPKVLTEFSPHGLSGFDKEGSPGKHSSIYPHNSGLFKSRFSLVVHSDHRAIRRHGHVGMPSLDVPSRFHSRHRPESGVLHEHRAGAEQNAWTVGPTVCDIVRYERFQSEAVHMATG